jgi:hypothetical protein
MPGLVSAGQDPGEGRHGVIIASYASAVPIPLRTMIRVLCASLLVFAISWPASADNAKPLTTIILVAQAELRDPNFKDSVVLVMNNIGPAPAGIIINRPTRIAVSRLFPDLERLAQLDDKVYFGGPVEIESVSFLVHWTLAPVEASAIFDGKSELPWPEQQTPDAGHRT